MIEIKVYQNGYEIIGHAEEKICHQVSFLDWIASGMIIGLDKDARRYTSSNDNPGNPNEGLSWAVCDPKKNNLSWIIEDFFVSAERWGEEYWKGQVLINRIDNILLKG